MIEVVPPLVRFTKRGKAKSIEELFWNKVRKTPDCWFWTGCISDFGHGVVRILDKPHRAHRVSYMWEYGAIDSELCVLHKCDNPPCVRPTHLFLGTKKDNTHDMISKGRAKLSNPLPGEQSGASKLKNVDVIEIRRCYASMELNQYELAQKYNVSQGTIGFILRGETWKHLL